MALLSDFNPTQATVDRVKMLFMERFPDLMMKEAWMPEDSLTNEASNQAQLSQGQVSTLALQPLSQLLPPISAEHLEQEDVKSEANPSPQFLLSQCLDPTVLVLIQDSPTNEALNQAQLHQDQVSTLVLRLRPKPYSQSRRSILDKMSDSKQILHLNPCCHNV